MILVEEHPRNELVAEYVDRYQLFIIDKPAYLKTIPNGKIECYINVEGTFESLDLETNTFQNSGINGFIPATNQTTLYQIPEGLTCINIKLNLNILSLHGFKGFLSEWKSHQVSDLITEQKQTQIIKSIDKKNPALDVDLLDSSLVGYFKMQEHDPVIKKLISFIEIELTSEFKVARLADHMHMTTKTLERWTKKHFNLPPKELWKVIRFETTTSYLKNSQSCKLIDALSFGYYDQSHFIKECKRITGYSPKSFFSKLSLPTNDIIFENKPKN